MKFATAIIIGAGQSGLAMSWHLTTRSVDHVVLERGEVANSWSTERWDSLRLLTPNWQTRLPAYAYTGDDPDGFMTMPEVVRFLQRYANLFCAPIRTGTHVTQVRQKDGGFEVETNHGRGAAASSHSDQAAILPRSHRPALVCLRMWRASPLAIQIQVSAGRGRDDRRCIGEWHPTRVEIQAAGRRVVLRRRTRPEAADPRGRDIQWMDAIGAADLATTHYRGH